MARKSEKSLLSRMIDGDQLSFSQQLVMIIQLSIPAILAQISNIIMQYIDASMVGRLGASDSASIGLVSSTTWLFGGLCTAAATGFTVKIAHRCGAKELSSARNIMKLGLVCTAIFGVILLILGASLSPILPRLLGGEESIRQGA
ncbi:MAG: MATE family efflux transporter, partial [Ruminococcus sp.]|nr:MATE family efflux transporter [Ruminococcus sp.]